MASQGLEIGYIKLRLDLPLRVRKMVYYRASQGRAPRRVHRRVRKDVWIRYHSVEAPHRNKIIGTKTLF